jgi:cytoskeletal protein RodZ
VQAVTAGCATRDGFGYAAGKDGDRWLGFSFGHSALVTMDADTVLISQAAAIDYQQKLDAEQRERAAQQAVPANVGSGVPGTPLPGQRPVASKSDATTAATAAVALPNRFFGLVEVDATTATMDFSTIVNEVIQHFAAQSGVDVTVTVEIEARTRDGFEAGLQRTIKENCGVLKFRSANFEQE